MRVEDIREGVVYRGRLTSQSRQVLRLFREGRHGRVTWVQRPDLADAPRPARSGPPEPKTSLLGGFAEWADHALTEAEIQEILARRQVARTARGRRSLLHEAGSEAAYTVTAHRRHGHPHEFIVSFRPHSPQRVAGERVRRDLFPPPRAVVEATAAGLTLTWQRPPSDPDAGWRELEEQALSLVRPHFALAPPDEDRPTGGSAHE